MFLESFERTNLHSISHLLDIPHRIYSKILPLYHDTSPIYDNCAGWPHTRWILKQSQDQRKS